MATAELTPEQRVQRANELRSRVLIGRLPDDFLRLPSTSAPGQLPVSALDPAAAQFFTFVPPNTRGRLVVKVVQGQLSKNYGILRMDPYLRLRIGNAVFETHTNVNGGKTPTWNRLINAYLPNGVESLYLQIFDERSFTQDECVAWAHVVLPVGIFNGDTVDEWFPLSGAMGDKQEGAVNLVISFTPVTQPPQDQSVQPPVVVQPTATQPQQQRELISEAELDEICSMFPNIEKEVITGVLEANRGDKNATVNALLEMA